MERLERSGRLGMEPHPTRAPVRSGGLADRRLVDGPGRAVAISGVSSIRTKQGVFLIFC